MSSDDLPEGVSALPPRTAEELTVLRAKASENTKRVAQEIREYEKRENLTWMDDVLGFAKREIEAWQAFPCRGEVELVGECSSSYAATCERADMGTCPRRQIQWHRDREAAKRAKRREQLIQIGVPLNALEMVFDKDPIETEAMKAIGEWMQGNATFLVLSAGVGCGKSCAAAWWASEVFARFVKSMAFGRMSPYEESSRAVFEARSLVIDDLGAEYLDVKGHLLSQVDALFDERYANRLPTVITTNLDVVGFKSRYGERVSDRLRESGVFKLVGGKSMRRRSS
jgi:DNA replication protein DnaC